LLKEGGFTSRKKPVRTPGGGARINATHLDHMPERRPGAGDAKVSAEGNNEYRTTFRCARCTSLKKKTQTYQWCATCAKSLCIDCFKDYHAELKAEQDRRLGQE
jgi:hypothetical protein